MSMRVDMRVHPQIREQVHAGISALRVQARQVWGTESISLSEMALWLRLSAEVLERLARAFPDRPMMASARDVDAGRIELQRELGNIIFSTIRWIDDLGFDARECLDLAIKWAPPAQPKAEEKSR
jgi:hypothetical protein